MYFPFMPLPINRNQPLLMHVDLNSCFATIEQQANPLLRGKPIVVAAYNSPNGCVVAPSIEAKRFGIKTGMTVRDARLLYPPVIVRTPDPAKYRAVHMQFRNIFKDYSPAVSPKSIDEAVIDFTDTYALYNRSLTDIGREIKRRFREEIGEWMQCSIGISTNRFLAKLAASLKKPDGLETIDHTTVEAVYQRVSLLDLNGINTRYEARLNASGIFTPMEFYQASLETLKKQVFQSIVGYYWYLRLRGYEIDQVDFGRKSFGNTYALGKQTNDPRELAKLLLKLCEKTGRRLRKAGYAAQGVHVSCVYTDFSFWHTGRKVEQPLYTTREIYLKALRLLNQSGYVKGVRNLAVSVYDLIPHQSEQLEMFASRSHAVAQAMDKINDKYGEFVITPALMMGMDETIIDWISFGRGKESYQTIRNGLVRPLLRIKGCVVAWAGCQAVYPAG
jgi:DNA polymerase-4